MINRILIILALCLLGNSAAMAANPASQDWVKTWVTANFTPKTGAINWSSLCPSGQSLTDSTGCTPNCNSGAAAATCNTVFSLGNVEQLSRIPLPYLDNGVVVFQLTQTTSTGPEVSLVIALNSAPTNYGYMCEILNANGTPATLWDAEYTPIAFPNTIITLDSNLNTPPYASDHFVNAYAQPLGSAFYWYNNPKNPLYMMCLGYQVAAGSNNLQSYPACGGTTGATCISYSIQ